MFTEGQARFKEVDAVANGLGPRFNMDSCAGCHAFPDVGGSSPLSNPQVNVASSQNIVPSFITANGPVREVRFVKNPDGTADGGVHDLFTIVGRSDAPSGCTSSILRQPNFAAQAAIASAYPWITSTSALLPADEAEFKRDPRALLRTTAA